MKRLRTLALILTMVGATMALSPAQSAPISLTDPTNDVSSRVVGCYRASAPATCPRDSSTEPGNGQLDLTAGSFEGTGGHYIMSFTSRVAWPKHGALASTLPGVTSLSVRWVFNNNAQQNRVENVNYNCTGKKSLPGYGNPDVEEVVKFNWTDNTASCGWLTEGPFPRSDGYSFFYILTTRLVGGKFKYEWSWGWFEELTQIFYSQNIPNPHDDNDLVTDKALINGQTFASLVPGSLGTPTLTLQAPYTLRKDFSNDNDPSTNEEVTDYFGRPGQAIEGVTIGSYASASATFPEPGLCPANNAGWGALGEQAGPIVGGIAAPIIRGNAPAPYNDPEFCISQGVGLTISGDWIPGNPYAAGGPNWGGFLPRVFPRALSYLPGAATGQLNGATCNYPLGLALLQPWVGYAPNGVSGGGMATYMSGGTVTVGGATTLPIPIIPGNTTVGSTNVPLPTGQYHACNNFYLQDGLHFVNATGPAVPIT